MVNEGKTQVDRKRPACALEPFCTGLSTAGRRTDCRSWHRRFRFALWKGEPRRLWIGSRRPLWITPDTSGPYLILVRGTFGLTGVAST